ncbi:hypothetical protein BGZ47_001695, partial [Haplosporangium gracile]
MSGQPIDTRLQILERTMMLRPATNSGLTVSKKKEANPCSLTVSKISSAFMCLLGAKFQLKIMADNKGIVCMDSTHRTVKLLNSDPKNPRVHGTAYLFTVLVKDRQLRSGISTASMICNSES